MLLVMTAKRHETGISDHELLSEYQKGSDEAFEQIVHRHSDMVYAVCHRTLSSEAAAEDAAQATFLLFTRKAASIASEISLSGWLYLAARNTARQYRRAVLRRSRYEREAAEIMPESSKSDLWEQVRPELDSAVEDLPAAQREAVILRFFYGLSEAEAARQAGCPEKTLRSRVSRAVERLRERLCRRQAVVSSLALFALLSERGAQAAPSALSSAIVNVGLGKAVATATALSTTDATLKALSLAKIKMTLLCALVVLSISAPLAYYALNALKNAPSAPVPETLGQSSEVSSALVIYDAKAKVSWEALMGKGGSVKLARVAPAQDATLLIDFDLTTAAAWGDAYLALAPQDWRQFDGIEFWFCGNGTGDQFTLEIWDDNPLGQRADQHERFVHSFVDSSNTWRSVRVLWSEFQRRQDWQPPEALDDGFNRSAVAGIGFWMPPGKKQRVYLDTIRLVTLTTLGTP